jgi:hypothetical protein
MKAQKPTANEIDAFFADSDVLQLISLSSRSLPLAICYPGELAVSNFLCWLLDPSEGHGLGDMAIKALLNQAWHSAKDMKLEPQVRAALTPATVQTNGYSGMLAIAETSLQTKRLDVLAVDATKKLYIAIENKFGAKQSDGQLGNYRTYLRKMFKGFAGVHLYLDWNDKLPSDSHWIPVGYEWLVEFLRHAEERSATAEHVRATLAQFRIALKFEEEESGSDSLENRAIARIASQHESVVSVMAEWLYVANVRDRAAEFGKLINVTGVLAVAHRQLYQMFLRRPEYWARCARVVGMASFLTRLHQNFNSVLVDQRRKLTIFSLAEFEELIDPVMIDDWFYPAYVSVIKNVDKYLVEVYLDTTSVRPEMRGKLEVLAEEMAAHANIVRRTTNNAAWHRVKSQKNLTHSEALTVVEDSMRALKSSVTALKLQPDG